MKAIKVKIARIGNSRGLRIPAATLARYQIGDTVLMEERSDGILLRPHDSGTTKLSWEETAAAMSAEPDEWGEWDVVAADGLDELRWDSETTRRVAEPRAEYMAPTAKRKRSSAK